MENYILNLYKKWLKEKNGNLFKQISRLTTTAIILLSLLFASLISLLIIFVLSFTDKNVMNAAYIPMIADVILSIIISIYMEKHHIDYSKCDLSNYRKHCDDLEKELTDNDIAIQLIPKLIEKFNNQNNEIEERIRQKREYVNKFMEMLLIPIAAAILGALMNKSNSLDEILHLGIYGLLIILLTYGAIIFVLFLYNTVMRIPESMHKRLIMDLQGILDFYECKNEMESSDSVDNLVIR